MEGVAVPRRLTKSSGELESEVISSALIAVLMFCDEDACGMKVTDRGQLPPGTMVAQELVTVKSGADPSPIM